MSVIDATSLQGALIQAFPAVATVIQDKINQRAKIKKIAVDIVGLPFMMSPNGLLVCYVQYNRVFKQIGSPDFDKSLSLEIIKDLFKEALKNLMELGVYGECRALIMISGIRRDRTLWEKKIALALQGHLIPIEAIPIT